MKPDAFPCKTSCKNTLLCDWWTGIVFKELCLIKKKRRELHDSEKESSTTLLRRVSKHTQRASKLRRVSKLIHSEPAKHLWNRRVIILVYIIYKNWTFDDQHGRRLTERRVNQVTILKEEMKRRIWHYYFLEWLKNNKQLWYLQCFMKGTVGNDCVKIVQDQVHRELHRLESRCEEAHTRANWSQIWSCPGMRTQKCTLKWKWTTAISANCHWCTC